MSPDLTSLIPSEILARSEVVLRRRRQAEVDDLELVLAWADAHSCDVEVQVPGGDRLVEIGGDGTPQVRDLCLEELAVARQVHVLSLRAAMADALDLRHRLPRVWAAVRELRCETWVARKVASMSRRLDRDQVAVVDLAVSACVGHAPSRVLAVAEAKVHEADTEARAAELATARRTTGVWLTRPRPGTHDDGIRSLVARLTIADAVWLDATVDRVADALAADAELAARFAADLPDAAGGDVRKDHFRAAALGLLGRPDELAALLRLLDHAGDLQDDQDGQGERGGEGERHGRRRRPHHRQAVLYVHLHHDALAGLPAVARVEGLGALLLEQVTALLGHTDVTLRPVIDLNTGAATHAYEHPTTVKERTLLRTGGDVFPHASSTSRRLDHDHPTPYDPLAPAPQTGDHNDAPLTRHEHRAKTHLAYRVRHLAPGTYLWTTPHGLNRLVTQDGTHLIEPAVRRAIELVLAA